MTVKDIHLHNCEKQIAEIPVATEAVVLTAFYPQTVKNKLQFGITHFLDISNGEFYKWGDNRFRKWGPIWKKKLIAVRFQFFFKSYVNLNMSSFNDEL